jgi:hypothetical protein
MFGTDGDVGRRILDGGNKKEKTVTNILKKSWQHQERAESLTTDATPPFNWSHLKYFTAHYLQ